VIHYGPPEQPTSYQPDPHTPPPDTWEPMPDETDHWYDQQAEREQWPPMPPLPDVSTSRGYVRYRTVDSPGVILTWQYDATDHE
jgi:hypothetical protein